MFITFIDCVCVCVCVCGGHRTTFKSCPLSLSLSYHHVAFGNKTQVIRFSSKHPYPLSHLVSPLFHSLKYLLIVFNYIRMCVCKSVGLCIHVCSSWGDQKGVSDPLEQELLAAVSYQTWVLGLKLRSSIKAVHALNCWALLPAHYFTLWKNIIIIYNTGFAVLGTKSSVPDSVLFFSH